MPGITPPLLISPLSSQWRREERRRKYWEAVMSAADNTVLVAALITCSSVNNVTSVSILRKDWRFTLGSWKNPGRWSFGTICCLLKDYTAVEADLSLSRSASMSTSISTKKSS